MSVFLAGTTPAIQYTAQVLKQQGIHVVRNPEWEVTDVLLDVPTFRPGGMTRERLDTLLASLPGNVRLWGGNLSVDGYTCTDLLKYEPYLWDNAAITARCAMNLTQQNWDGCPVLILGWGRIGTHLAKLLTDQGAAVTLAVRNDIQKLRLCALGYQAVNYSQLPPLLFRFRVVFNTVPRPMLHGADLPENCVKIDLASQRGIPGDNVIWARGLPGTHAPEESGKLIADTFLRLRKELTP